MTTPDFPQLPGINTEDGLARMMHKPSLYEKVLRDFHARFIDELPQLQVLLAGADYAAAAHRVHSAKGLAGTIGAIALQDLARQLEAPLREGQAPAGEQLAAFAAELERVLQGIRSAFPG
ncbi:Hpt domain-containing protein [Dechloromonas sp. ZY10]|uniref:Hpt domain-containing protein n=1 Tax=Dechloromonas aquae TaxID=2664436 RepID=UPI003527446A